MSNLFEMSMDTLPTISIARLTFWCFRISLL